MRPGSVPREIQLARVQEKTLLGVRSLRGEAERQRVAMPVYKNRTEQTASGVRRMTISLEKKLEEATDAKKRYRALFLAAFLLRVGVLGIVYHATVLDYDNCG
jgi:hypothetical protein